MAAAAERVVCVTFAGRRRYLEILFRYMDRLRPRVDEYVVHVCTAVPDDVACIDAYAERHPGWVRLVRHPPGIDRAEAWAAAYRGCQDAGTVYVKVDDDIVYLEESLFTDLVAFRRAHPEYILVLPTILNNSVISWDMERRGVLAGLPARSRIGDTWPDTYRRIRHALPRGIKIGDVTRLDEVLCPVAWGNAGYAEAVHRAFLDDAERGQLAKYREGGPWVLESCEPISIQCCAWLGEDLARLTRAHGDVYEDEPWMTVFCPTWSGRRNCVYRGSVVAHFSYYVQQAALDASGALERYRALAPSPDLSKIQAPIN